MPEESANGYKYLRGRLNEHEKLSSERHLSVEKELTQLFGATNRVLEIDNTVRNLQKDVEHIKADLVWLKKFFWVIATASIGSLVAGLMNFVLK